MSAVPMRLSCRSSTFYRDCTSILLAADHLIDSIHRLIREAEQQTRRRCEEVALRAASDHSAEQVALAIRALGAHGTGATQD